MYTSLISNNFKLEGKLAKNSAIFIISIPLFKKKLPTHYRSIKHMLKHLTLLQIGCIS